MYLKGKKLFVIAAVVLMAIPVITIGPGDVDAGRPMFQASMEVLSGLDRLNVQKPMDIQVAPDGRIIILYQTMRAYNWDVYLVYSDDEGKTWSEPVRVDDSLRDNNETDANNYSNQLNPSMAIGSDGTVYVIWEDWRKWLDGPNTRPVEIRFARSSNGSVFGESSIITPPKQINTWDAFAPDIAINDQGRLFCVWLDEVDAGAYRNVWSSYSTNNGADWSAPIMLNHDGKDYRNHHYPRCAMYGDRVYVTWHDMRNSTMGTKPFVAISDDGGVSFGEETPLTTDSQVGSSREYAEPAVDDEGNLYIVWMDDRTERDEVFFTRSEDGGTSFSTDSRIFTMPDNVEDMDPFITAKDNGEIAVVWEREVPYDGGVEKDVYYINSSDGGRTWAPILRVDDTDRFKDDHTDQDDIVVAFNNDGRALCAYRSNWNPGGVVGSYDFNIFFTRHSRSLSSVNHLPELLRPDFVGPYGFDPFIGNTDSLFNFTLTYRDEDNDEPAAGFPRVQIFRDPLGSDPLYNDWTPMKKVKGARDIYYMDGVDYFVDLNISEEGRFYWRMQVNDGVSSSIISSAVRLGPLIDTTPPTLEITSPEGKTWFSAPRMECRVTVRDAGGSGVRNTSIKYVRSVRGLEYFESPVKVSGWGRLDNDTFEAWANVSLDPGTENYVKFVASDRVGNGMSESAPVNIWLDPDPPYAVEPLPPGNEVMIYGLVNCSIIWRDANPGSTLVNHTGLDPGSIRYAYRTTSGELSEWLSPEGYVPIENESYRAWAHVEFPDEGVYNFIKWRASDLVGNVFETREYRVAVDIPENYAPVFRGSGYPPLISSPTPHLWWDSAYDEENDPLYYRVMILKYPSELQLTGWIDIGMRTYFDVPDSESLVPNYYILRINASDRIGGWDVMDHVFQIIDTGTPPPAEVPPFGPFNTSDVNLTVSWCVSPDDDGNVTYHIRIGSEEYGGDILEWKDLRNSNRMSLAGLSLGAGIYSIQVMVSRGDNRSRVTMGVLKINDYFLKTEHPAAHIAYKGEGIRITQPIKCEIVNMATFDDTVTVRLQGELVDRNWAYLSDSETAVSRYHVNSSKGLSQEEPFEFTITVAAPDEARNGDYIITYVLISEDGITNTSSGQIKVTLKNAPGSESGVTFTDDLSNVITDVLPFLKGLPPGLVILIFVLFLLSIIVGIVFLGLSLVKRSQRKKSEDPLAEQKRVYREIYGREPSAEELEMMKQTDERSVEDIVKEEKKEEEGASEVKESGGDVEDKSSTAVKEELGEKIETGDKDTNELLERLFD